MTMGASVVTYTVDTKDADELERRVREHLVPAARQTKGYRGFLLLDQGDDKRLAFLLYDSVDDARAAQGVLTPIGSQHTYALMSGPAIGSLGDVVVSDGAFGDPATS